MVNRQLYLVDQRRAHEQVLFEKYSSQLNASAVPCQQLLFPRTIELQTADFEIIQSLLADINQLGFDVSVFGKNTIIVNGTPADISKGEEKEILEGILEHYKLNQQSLKLDKRENLARSLAKNAGIKRGMVLEQDQINQLVQDLFACQHPKYTPSGQVTFVSMEQNRLTELFE